MKKNKNKIEENKFKREFKTGKMQYQSEVK